MINSDKRFSVDEQNNLMMVLWNNELPITNRNEFSPAANFIYVPAGWKVTGVCQIPGTSPYRRNDDGDGHIQPENRAPELCGS